MLVRLFAYERNRDAVVFPLFAYLADGLDVRQEVLEIAVIVALVRFLFD